MKKSAFLLLALLLIPAAQSLAQPPQAAAPAASSVTSPAPVPTDKAEFLAILADGQSQGLSDLVPAPSFTAGCTSSSQCPKGQLCCYPCGADIDCSRTCLNAVNGHCPLFV
jgi:hypothetical protein